MLGSGEAEFEEWMKWAEEANKEKFRGWVGFSVPMAHRITAGYTLSSTPLPGLASSCLVVGPELSRRGVEDRSMCRCVIRRCDREAGGTERESWRDVGRGARCAESNVGVFQGFFSGIFWCFLGFFWVS